MSRRFLLFSSFLFQVLFFSGFQGNSQSGIWTTVTVVRATDGARSTAGAPVSFSEWSFSRSGFDATMSRIQQTAQSVSLDMPLPDGRVLPFVIKETPVFSESLLQKYPGFTSITGVTSDKSLVLKLSVSPFGVNGMILGLAEGPVFIDPFFAGERATYQSYFRKDFVAEKRPFFCGVAGEEAIMHSETLYTGQDKATVISGDCQLRTYRLALACTGEYARFHGGTIPKVLAAFNKSMTRVNGVYERDVAVTMKLVGDTDKLIFLDPSTDPYTNSDGGAMLDQNQQAIGDIIGEANYDIGHVFSTGGGGIAQLRAPCGGGKARGVTGLSSPQGDPFDIDYVCHEMGHQFGANHTQNNECQRHQPTAMEPGSGSTIMGYAGICDPNVQNNSDAHFHAVSVEEIRNFVIAGNGNTCAERTVIDNTPPRISDMSRTFIIPASTAFVLEAKATDDEGDALSYCWEQTDNDIATMPPVPANKVGPAFRSLPPSKEAGRYFPDLSRKFAQWEVLPSVSRQMEFTCVVRDNNPEGGCTESLVHEVSVTSAAGPFLVINPNLPSVNWQVGSLQTVRWNVAKTDLPPVECSKVDIFLSVDGGKSYPHPLAMGVPNTGTAEIRTPGIPTTQARVMVKASENIFFDVSNASFRITASFNWDLADTTYIICDQNTLSIPFNITGNGALAKPLAIAVSGLPAGVTATISPEEITTLPAVGTIELVGTQSMPLGALTITLEGVTGQEQLTRSVNLFREEISPVTMNLLTPAAGKGDVNGSRTLFSWQAIPGVAAYVLDVSTSRDFNPLLFSTEVLSASLDTSLEGGRVYFWRVKPLSFCTDHPVSASRAFRTKGLSAGTALVLASNPIVVDKGEQKIYTKKELDIAAASPEFVLCTIEALPLHGQLLLSGAAIAQGSYFTFDDLLRGAVSYQHDGGAGQSDTFRLSVLDDKGRIRENVICLVRIRQGVLGVSAIVLNSLRCAEDEDGAIEAIADGGVLPYEYRINSSSSQKTTVFTGLTAGQYTVVVRDASGDTAVSNVLLLSSPSPVVVSAEQSNYDIFIAASGGTGALSYSLDGAVFVETNTFADPGNGDFVVYVRDEVGCVSSDSVTINIPALTLTATLVKDIDCAGQEAQINCEARGGIPPYRFSADSVAFEGNSSLKVSAGTYRVLVRDAGGKIVHADEVQTNMPAPIQILLIQNRFQVVVVATGGTGKLQYSTNSNTYTDQDTFNFPQNGIYKIFVRDEKGCVRSTEVNLNILTNVQVNTIPVSCPGRSDGRVELLPTNGRPPFRYSVGGGSAGTNRLFSGLSAGTYAYRVWDGANDSLSGTFDILAPDSILVTTEVIGDTLIVRATGGYPPYQFSIDGGIAFLETNFFDNLITGIYALAVRDSRGCVMTAGDVTVISSVSGVRRGECTLVPNPVSQWLHLRCDQTSSTDSPLVVSAVGQNMGSIFWTREGEDWVADVSLLPPGLYSVRYVLRGNVQVLPFLKL